MEIMTLRKILLPACGGLLVAVFAAAAVAWLPDRQPKLLHEEEVIASVLRLYPGEVTGADLEGRIYKVSLATETGSYMLKVNAEDAAVLSIARSGGAKMSGSAVGPDTAAVAPAPETAAKLAESSKPVAGTASRPNVQSPAADSSGKSGKSDSSQPGINDSKEAAQIALQHVPGKVNKVVAGKEQDYLVEIQTNEGEEAVVQLHQVTGALLSVTWDDLDEDDDDDGDEKDDGDAQDGPDQREDDDD